MMAMIVILKETRKEIKGEVELEHGFCFSRNICGPTTASHLGSVTLAATVAVVDVSNAANVAGMMAL